MTAGAELENAPSSRWSTILGQYMSQPVTNISSGGVSNSTIARTTIDYLLQTANPITRVIIGWTSCDRTELSLVTGDWLYITPQACFAGDQSLSANPSLEYQHTLHDNWYHWHHNTYNAVTDSVRDILTVTAFCRQRDIEITNFFAMPDTLYQTINDPLELVRTAQRWYQCFSLEDLEHRDPDLEARAVQNLSVMIQALPRDTWFLWGNNLVHECRNFPHGSGLHPLEAAQEHFAKLLYDHIRQR
jgi:hypothetical protein